jgi:phosphate uptake regulator
MEPRKVQRVGSSTLSVSLPSDWVKSVGLRKGDLIYFNQESDDSLKLKKSSEFEEEKKPEGVEIYADLCKSPNMLSRIIVGNYMLGRDVIKVTSNTRLKSEHINEVRDTVQKLMGIAIMEETPNSIVLQSSIDILKFPIHTIIRRMFIIAHTIYEEAMNSLFESNLALAEDNIRRQGEADRMYWVVLRLLDSAQKDERIADKIHIEDPMYILWYRVVAQCLGLITRWSTKISNKVIGLGDNRNLIGEQLLKEIVDMSEMAHGICHQAINSLFSNDIELANQTIEEYNWIQDIEEQLQEKIFYRKSFKKEKPIEPKMLAHLSFILWSIRRTAELSSEIAEIAITKAVSKQTKICKEIDTSLILTL